VKYWGIILNYFICC